MTGIVHAVGVSICRLSALVAFGNHFVSDAFSSSVVKDKILTAKFIFDAFELGSSGIFDK
jgi:hypothetical protein